MQQLMTERLDGKKVREARLAKHMTQRQLAQAADISHETVNRIERAEEPRTVYPLTARKLADALEVDTAELLANW